MKIDKIKLNGEEISFEEGRKIVLEYIKDHMTMESFMGGIAIILPIGTLQAEVSLV